MNVNESIEYLRKKNIETFGDSICLDSFFYCYDSNIRNSSTFLSFMMDVGIKIQNNEPFIVTQDEFVMLEEAKSFLKKDVYCVCFLNWIEHFCNPAEKSFKQSLDKSIEYYFSNSDEPYANLNISHLLTLSKRILNNNLDHIISKIKRLIVGREKN